MTKICIVPQVSGVGGMVSFRGKFTAGLQSRGIEVTHNAAALNSSIHYLLSGAPEIFVAYGVRNAAGVRIVQRLNGMNWLHRLQRTGIKHYSASRVRQLEFDN